MIDQRLTPYRAILLRVTLGELFIAHAGLKLLVFTSIGTAYFFDSLGLPPALGPFMIVLEAIGGLCLVLSVYVCPAALALIPDLLGAIFFEHIHNEFFFNDPKGGWEYSAT